MSAIISIEYFKTPVGELILGAYKHQLCMADWRYRKMRTSIDSRIKAALNAEYVEGSSEIMEKTKLQLSEYFAGSRKQFDLDLLLIGTDFQKEV